MGVLKTITNEYFFDSIRIEDGVIIKIDGKKCAIKKEDYDFVDRLIPMNDNGDLFIKKEYDFFNEPIYIGCFRNLEDENCYVYMLESDFNETNNKKIEKGFIKNLAQCPDGQGFDDDFYWLKVLYEAGCGIDLEEFSEYKYFDNEPYIIEGDRTYKIYTSEDSANEDALEYIKDIIENDSNNGYYQKNVIDRYRQFTNDDWIDNDALEEFWKDDFRSYYDDIKNEPSSDYGNRLYEELIDDEIIENTSEYFKTDHNSPNFDIEDYEEELIEKIMEDDECSKEEAIEKVNNMEDEEIIENLLSYNIIEDNEENFELDYTEPKFNDEDVIENAVETRLNNMDDYVDEWFFNFGGEFPAEYVDEDKLAESILDSDGRGNFLSFYDGNEYYCEIDDNEYFIYID